MSAVTAIHEQHAAAKRRLAAVLDDAREREFAHDRNTKAKVAQLAEAEAAYAANATARALGEEPTQELPDGTILEKLRADISVAEPVARQLAANRERCEKNLQAAEAKHNSAVADYLRDTALAAARSELNDAWNVLREKAAKVMAAHKLVYHDFNDRPTTPNCYDDLHGPVAYLLSAMVQLPFEQWPYSVRPSWLPQHGRYFPGDMPGVEERTAELLAEVEQVPA